MPAWNKDHVYVIVAAIKETTRYQDFHDLNKYDNPEECYATLDNSQVEHFTHQEIIFFRNGYDSMVTFYYEYYNFDNDCDNCYYAPIISKLPELRYRVHLVIDNVYNSNNIYDIFDF